MDRLRMVHDRDLSAEALRDREIARRKHEIDAQIVNALEKGNPVELLLTHPAGLILNRGGCRWLNYAPGDEGLKPSDRQGYQMEVAYVRARYADLKGRFDAGEEFAPLDAEIAGRVRAGKRKGDVDLDALAAIKVRSVKAKRGESGPEARKFARARGHKDLSEFLFRERGKAGGWLREVSDAELRDEHERALVALVGRVNAERDELGLPQVELMPKAGGK